MLLNCPSCDVRFMVDDALIGAGRTVKCGSCSHSWFVAPEVAVEEIAPEQAVDTSHEPVVEDMADVAQIVSHIARKEQAVAQAKTGSLKILAASLALLLCITGLYAFRDTLYVPGLSALLGMKPSDGVRLADINLSNKGEAEGKADYVVVGKIVNTADAPRSIPTLHVALLDAEGGIITSREYVADKTLAPGEHTPFTAAGLSTVRRDALASVLVELGNGVELMLRE